MMQTRRPFQLLAILTAASASMIAATNASAAPNTPDEPATRVTAGLHVGGFDARVAEAHGYKIATRPDGRQTSIPANAKIPTTSIHPLGYDETEGDCGESYIDFRGTGASAAVLSTGFTLNPGYADAIQIVWNVHIHDTRGDSDQPWKETHITGISDWHPDSRVLGLTRGPAEAWVSNSSIAILWDGTICYSYGPRTDTMIY